MTQPTAYQNLVSPRSRRLRTVGILLLLAVVGMTIYGALVIMPSLRAASQQYARRQTSGAAVNFRSNLASPTRRERRALQVQVLFADVYWVACGLLTLGAISVAWLDFREVSRNYVEQRRALVQASTQRIDLEKEQSE